MTAAASKPMPYTIAVDTREQLGYEFAQPYRVGNYYFSFSTTRTTLNAGDYSIVGFESAPAGVAVERKSLADAFGTFGRGRDRFERELARLSLYKFAAVVIEAEWSTIFASPPSRAKLHPRSILGSIIAWQVRYPTIQWNFLPGRDAAEGYTARLLDRFYRERAACGELTVLSEQRVFVDHRYNPPLEEKK